jgi:hypothetical protein
MEQLTPWFLLIAGAAGTVLWFIIRRSITRQDVTSSQIAVSAEQLNKLSSVSGDIAAIVVSMHNLEALVKDELRRFDVRITRLEARAEVRAEK